MPHRGRRRKKSRTHVSATENESGQSALASQKEERIPKSLVIRRGKTAPEVEELVTDLRQLLLPYTALHFQEDPKNRKLTLNQYATHLALPMGITHMMALTQNDERLHLRLARTPVGPTLSFRVHQFSLNRHVKALQKRPVSSTGLVHAPPVVVTNNFGDASASPETKLMRITFQNMFPSINVATVKLTDCRRVVLFQLIEEQVDDEEEEDDATNDQQKEKRIRRRVEMRHYCIKATPTGVHRRVRRLVQANKVPNLSKCQDIADYLQSQAMQSDGGASDSEPEDDSAQVQLPDRYVGRGNNKAQKSALKLIEMGPRLSLELIKVEKGLGGGEVLYHAHVKKSASEAAALADRKSKERARKEGMVAQQAANVERKRLAAQEKREAKRQRTAARQEAAMQALRDGVVVAEDDNDDESDEEAESEEE